MSVANGSSHNKVTVGGIANVGTGPTEVVFLDSLVESTSMPATSKSDPSGEGSLTTEETHNRKTTSRMPNPLETDDNSFLGDDDASSVSSTASSSDEEIEGASARRKADLPPYNSAWPSYLAQLTSFPHNGDDWEPVMDRIQTHREEILISGPEGGNTALHAACNRYPPPHVVQAMTEACPEAAYRQNFGLETPLHSAMSCSSEEVQEILIHAAPETIGMRDQYGDTPLHFAVRQGATYELTELLIFRSPETISARNNRGVTPFWLLPRSYLEARNFHDIFVTPERNVTIGDLSDDDEDDDTSDNEEEGNSQKSWKLLVLFLRFSYYDKEEAMRTYNADANSIQVPQPAQYEWMVHAAAATPACPRETLHFLCGMFPDTCLQYNHQGFTPMLLATQAPIVQEPSLWDENEDGFRETVVHLEAEGSALSAGVHNAFLNHRIENQEAVDRPFQYAEVSSEIRTARRSLAKPSVIEILLQWCPKSASYRDRRGRTPLSHALLSGKSWDHIRGLIAECPRLLEERDAVTGQYMYELAAAHSPDLGTVYSVVRSLPSSMSALVARGRTCATVDESPPKKQNV
jgi:Ankyrin repeats (3 copies)